MDILSWKAAGTVGGWTRSFASQYPLDAGLRPRSGYSLAPNATISAFARDLAEALIAPLRVRAASQLTPAGRGFVYQLEQTLGTIHIEQAREQLQLLTCRDRQLLTSFGVHIGDQVAYLRQSIAPAAITERAALVSARNSLQAKFKDIPLGAASIVFCGDSVPTWLECIGYVGMGSIAVRADHYEFVWRELTRLSKARRVTFPQHLVVRLGCSAEQIEWALRSFGCLPNSPGRRTRNGFDPIQALILSCVNQKHVQTMMFTRLCFSGQLRLIHSRVSS